MIRELLPVGLRGLVAAALLAALMGTVSGALNSIATLFSYDIVKRWRPEIGDRSLVRDRTDHHLRRHDRGDPLVAVHRDGSRAFIRASSR